LLGHVPLHVVEVL